TQPLIGTLRSINATSGLRWSRPATDTSYSPTNITFPRAYKSQSVNGAPPSTTKIYLFNRGSSTANLNTTFTPIAGGSPTIQTSVLPVGGLATLNLATISSLPPGAYNVQIASDNPLHSN